MYLVGKVVYSEIHSLLPREAALVSIVEDVMFNDYNEALDYCRGLRVSGDYSYVPVEISDTVLKRSRKRKFKNKR